MTLLAFHIAQAHNRALPVNNEMRKATLEHSVTFEVAFR